MIMPIRLLTAMDSLSAGDSLAIGSANNGDDRKAAVSVLVTYLEDALDFSPSGAFINYLTQYATPSATGFSVQVTDADDNIHLILTPAAGYAAGTIVLPTSSNLIDKQEVIVNSTQPVTALTIDGNGATVIGEPSFLVANSFFRLKYDAGGNTWYLIGLGDTVALDSTASTVALRDTDTYLHSSDFVITQGAPAAKTTSATLTAAEIAGKLLTVNQGGGAPSALQLPLATAMDTQFDTVAADEAIDFSLINISTNAAETASITTNTGWTLVGNMLLAANTAVTDISQGRFRARRTGAGAWSLYRIA